MRALPNGHGLEERTISIDEMTGVQVLERKHPGLPLQSGQVLQCASSIFGIGRVAGSSMVMSSLDRSSSLLRIDAAGRRMPSPTYSACSPTICQPQSGTSSWTPEYPSKCERAALQSPHLPMAQVRRWNELNESWQTRLDSITGSTVNVEFRRIGKR